MIRQFYCFDCGQLAQVKYTYPDAVKYRLCNSCYFDKIVNESLCKDCFFRITDFYTKDGKIISICLNKKEIEPKKKCKDYLVSDKSNKEEVILLGKEKNKEGMFYQSGNVKRRIL